MSGSEPIRSLPSTEGRNPETAPAGGSSPRPSGSSGWSRPAQWLLAIGILAWLGYQTTRFDRDGWSHLVRSQVSWTLLGLATLAFFSAILLSFVRWRMLVHGLGVPLSLREALELGFLGYLSQFFSLGTVGGDVFKALVLVRRQPRQTASAVASVIVDRVVGFYGLILFGTFVFTAARWQAPLPAGLTHAPSIFLVLACLGAAVLWLVLRSGIELSRLVFGLRYLRRLLPLAVRLDAGLRLYRAHAGAVLNAIGLGVCGHLLFALSLTLTSVALAESHPSWISQMSIWPLAGSAGALPITPGGLGTFDAAYVFLYNLFAARAGQPELGVVLALAYRLMCLATAGIGTIVFFSRRRTWHQP